MEGSATVERSLSAVLRQERNRLINLWGDRITAAVAEAMLPRAELLDHMPAFVDELTRALHPEAMPLPITSANAEEHGEQRLGLGLDVAEVIREYGMLHECILKVADDAHLMISSREDLLIVKWMNVGIADAVSQYVKQRDLELQRQNSEHLGFIAHELRNPLGSVKLAFGRLSRSELKQSSTVEMVERGLKRMADMIDGALSHASLRLGVIPRLGPVALRPFLQEIETDAAIEAQARGIEIVIRAPEGLIVEADPRLLRSAVANLLHNALKFSHEHSKVVVEAARSEGRFTVEVTDGCGGLPPGKVEELFDPLVQRSPNRTGFGLGLGIALQAAEAHNGTIRVRDLPGQGCVFIVDLPTTGTSAASK